MFAIKFTDDPLVKRLRWVMMGAMLFSIVNTIGGQPASFWAHPETAMRGDGLSIHNPTNHTFEFFLDSGWAPYLIASLAYFSAACFLVSILPRRTALIVIFSFIFGHYFGAANWIAVRWHLGVAGASMYGVCLGWAVVLAGFPTFENRNSQAVARLRWLMLTVMMFDGANTLLGQPASYWHDPQTVRESNEFFRWFMVQGWAAYVLIDLVYYWGAFFLVSTLQETPALICIFSFIFVHYGGSSTWFFYRWRLGMVTPVLFGVLLSMLIVSMVFARSRKSVNCKPQTASGVCSAFC
jgi:hypothetical protein